MDIITLQKEIVKLRGIFKQDDIYDIILESRGREYVPSKKKHVKV